MNRRRFLSWLGAGAMVGAVAPYAVFSVLKPESVAKTGYDVVQRRV
jgi:hypothetical protein